jgi:hypothetical protein
MFFSHFKIRKTVFRQPAWRENGLKKRGIATEMTASAWKDLMRPGKLSGDAGVYCSGADCNGLVQPFIKTAQTESAGLPAEQD